MLTAAVMNREGLGLTGLVVDNRSDKAHYFRPLANRTNALKVARSQREDSSLLGSGPPSYPTTTRAYR